MKPSDLILRCYAEQEPDRTWFGICIDLNLAAEGDSFEEVRGKLHAMIHDYLAEALTVDGQYIGDLIPRKAPVYFRVRYHVIAWLARFRKAAVRRLFTEHLPLVPA
jgi:hypothetical protein